MSKKLHYFDFTGLAESIRYILFYTGQKFEDIRYQIKDWPIKEIKDSLPFGQMPVLEEDGKILHQSFAIARYLATNTELLPSDPWEQALVDAAALTIYDFDKPIYAYIQTLVQSDDTKKKEELRTKLYDEHLVFYLSRFEKQLEENNGYFCQKLSWADFILVVVLERSNLILQDNIEKNYPQVTALVNRIQNLPGVKEYIRDRTPYTIPVVSKTT